MTIISCSAHQIRTGTALLRRFFSYRWMVYKQYWCCVWPNTVQSFYRDTQDLNSNNAAECQKTERIYTISKLVGLSKNREIPGPRYHGAYCINTTVGVQTV